jgi:hypothetical protein
MTFPVSIKGVVIHAVESVNRHVFIATFGCEVNNPAEVVLSEEHTTANLFLGKELPTLNLPAGRPRAIKKWFSAPRTVA